MPAPVCPLTAAQVEAWDMIDSPDHRGRVPALSAAERQGWVDLLHAGAVRRLSASEGRLLLALDRKVRYRAERDRL